MSDLELLIIGLVVTVAGLAILLAKVVQIFGYWE